MLCSTLRALDHIDILRPSLVADRTVGELLGEIGASGFGYLRVGLRCLASQGWLADEPTFDPRTTVLRWTDSGRSAASSFENYVAVGEFLSGFSSTDSDAWSDAAWDPVRIDALGDLTELARERWALDPKIAPALRALCMTHLDAGLGVPAMLWLRSADRLSADGPLLAESETDAAIGRLLRAIGWLHDDDDSWTPQGAQAASLAVHFGMTASYLPLLAQLPKLYVGELIVAPTAAEREWHVHRPLNVAASTAAHRGYFDAADAIFTDLFDREPISAQPRFIADMGCGDGGWLVHLSQLIKERTARGRHLESEPLLMVGLDYNAAALEEARGALDAAGVPALLGLGDISDPDAAAAWLADHGVVMRDGLHIRAFVDHERSYSAEDPEVSVAGSSSGAYVDPRGRPLDGGAIERDLVVHFRRWAPHVGKHGLVILEAHCVAPKIARRHLGATHSVAFDAYHGYSHQYPVEHAAFLRCCRDAGLRPEIHHEARYPASRSFVAVSLNRFRVAAGTATPEQVLPAVGAAATRSDTWRPDASADVADGQALHELLYVGGDLRFPRQWCSAATGYVVRGALDAIDRRLASGRPGDTIRVLDYGAGTGLAAIELLKACRERGLEARLQRHQMAFELHLVDLPSGWFARGYELLKASAWTQFHSLRSPSGGFRPLLEVTGGRLMDAVMANMVFHLIPSGALERAATELASITASGGSLLWSSPDLGPAGPHAVLFHDANRAVRERWLAYSDGAADRAEPSSPRLVELLRRIRAPAGDTASGARAGRRILPLANSASDVAGALSDHFMGAIELHRPTYELLAEDLLDTLLVPSNQGEFLSEIIDRGDRELVIRELMLDEVLPEMQRQPGATALGLNVQWTLGKQAMV